MNLAYRALFTVTTTLAISQSLPANNAVVGRPTPNGQPPPDAPAAAVVPKYELKKLSSFALQNERRSPFWTIGWVKRVGKAADVTQVAKPKIDESAFTVTSILMGEPSLAVVNGRAYSEGEFVRIKGPTPIRLRVLRISDGSVTLQDEDQLIVVPLRRPELGARKPDVELLDEDR